MKRTTKLRSGKETRANPIYLSTFSLLLLERKLYVGVKKADDFAVVSDIGKKELLLSLLFLLFVVVLKKPMSGFGENCCCFKITVASSLKDLF